MHAAVAADRGQTSRHLVHSVITNAAATRAYLSYWSLGTVILDISDPAKPRYLGRTATGQGNAHSAWLMPGGKILLETHETVHGRPVVWNIADPAHPVRLATVRLPAGSGPAATTPALPLADSVHDPKAVGPLRLLLVVRPGRRALRPEEPAQAALRDPLPAAARRATGTGCSAPGGTCTAVWGVFVMPHYVLASDLNSGLWVLSRPR